VVDELTGRDEKPVSLAARISACCWMRKLRDDLVALAVARVRRDGAALSFMIPTTSRHYFSRRQRSVDGALRRVIEILDAKSESLAGQRRKDSTPYVANLLAHARDSFGARAAASPARAKTVPARSGIR